MADRTSSRFWSSFTRLETFVVTHAQLPPPGGQYALLGSVYTFPLSTSIDDFLLLWSCVLSYTRHMTTFQSIETPFKCTLECLGAYFVNFILTGSFRSILLPSSEDECIDIATCLPLNLPCARYTFGHFHSDVDRNSSDNFSATPTQ